MSLRIVSMLLHLYVGWRIAPALGSLAAGIAFATLLLISALTLPHALGARGRRAGHFAEPLAWTGLLSMGLFSTLLVLTLFRDASLLAVFLVEVMAPGTLAYAAWARASAVVVLFVSVAVTAWGFVNARRTARVRRVDVAIAGLPQALEGFTIAQISDIHVGPTIRRPYVEAVVAAVNALDADAVAITGDMIDGPVRQLGEHVAPLAGLRSREGTFFVTGNHEYYQGGAAGAAAWVREVRRLGITPLLNEHVVIRRGQTSLVLAGVTDFGAGHFDPGQASDPGAALAGSPPGAALKVLLAHQPRSAAAAEAAGFDLQLSGHTHGGQFWPWNHFVRLQQPFTAGLHRWRRMWVYTSRGTGYWGPPKRFGAPSEITLLRLVRAAPAVPRRVGHRGPMAPGMASA